MKSPLQVLLALLLLIISLDLVGVTPAPAVPESEYDLSYSEAQYSNVTVVLFDCTQTPSPTFQFNNILPHPSLKEHLHFWLPDGQICREAVDQIRQSKYLSISKFLEPGLSAVFIAFPFHYFY